MSAVTTSATQVSTAAAELDPRARLGAVAADLVRERADVALVYAEIGGQYFGSVARQHPDRVINVGIREQLLVDVGAGLALAGLTPIVHTFAPFLVERPFESLKLGFSHQDVGGVLASTGGSFDIAHGGRTHQTGGDVALVDTLPGWRIHVPGHADEVEALLRYAVSDGGRHYVRVEQPRNAQAHHAAPGEFATIRTRAGSGPTVVAVGATLDPTLAALEGRDATVLYASTVRPLDAAGLRAAVGDGTDVVLVEPYLAGTSTAQVTEALNDRPHRILSLGTRREEVRHYGRPSEHIAAHGLDAAGLRASIDRFLAG